MKPGWVQSTSALRRLSACIAYALAAGLLWGSLGLLTARMLAFGVSAAQSGLLRIAASALVCVLLCVLMGHWQRPRRRQWGVLLLIGLVCQSLGTVAFACAVASLGSVLAVLLFCSGPLFTALFDWLQGGVRPGASAVLALLAVVAGLAMALDPAPGLLAMADIPASGVAWGLLAGACYGAFPAFTRSLGTMGSTMVVSASLGIGALLLAPVLVLQPLPRLPWAAVLGTLLLLVLLPTVLADLCYVRAVQLGDGVLVSALALIEIPAAALYAWLLHGQALQPWQWAGLLLFCAGVVLLVLGRRHAVPRPPPPASMPPPSRPARH